MRERSTPTWQLLPTDTGQASSGIRVSGPAVNSSVLSSPTGTARARATNSSPSPATLQEDTWRELAATGLTQVPGNTFSYYDHVLDNALLFGAVPERFRPLLGELDPLDFYFTMCRGREDFPPLELVRWFGSNYHYRQPELDENTVFELNSAAVLDEFERAKADGIELRPVVLGPVSLLLLSKVAPTSAQEGFGTLDLLDSLLPAVREAVRAARPRRRHVRSARRAVVHRGSQRRRTGCAAPRIRRAGPRPTASAHPGHGTVRFLR